MSAHGTSPGNPPPRNITRKVAMSALIGGASGVVLGALLGLLVTFVPNQHVLWGEDVTQFVPVAGLGLIGAILCGGSRFGAALIVRLFSGKS